MVFEKSDQKRLCVYCQTRIQNVIITCSICDPFVTLCAPCFSCGVEIGEHKKEHDYNVKNVSDIPIFVTHRNEPWYASEDLSLIESVDHLGLSDWKSVSNEVSTRTDEECKHHFNELYISGSLNSTVCATFYKNRKRATAFTDHLVSTLSKPVSNNTINTALPDQSQLIGYMPLRDDYAIEYDQRAEFGVSNLSFNPSDNEIDLQIKNVQIDSLRRRLIERHKRKRIVRDLDLISESFEGGIDQSISGPPAKQSKSKTFNFNTKSSDSIRNIKSSLRVFTQFLSSDELNQFVENIIQQKKLKNQIEDLQKCRENGISKLSECSSYLEFIHKNVSSATGKEKTSANKKKLSMLNSSSTLSKKDGVLGKGENGNAVTSYLHKYNVRDMSKLPCYSLLAPKEKSLCRLIGLAPASYLTLKTCIVKDRLLQRCGVTVDATNGIHKRRFRKLKKVKVNRNTIGKNNKSDSSYKNGFSVSVQQQVISFLKDCGWFYE